MHPGRRPEVSMAWDQQMERLARERGSALVGYAYLLTGELTAAQDLVQEALIRTFSRHRRDDVEFLEAYVRRAILNTYLNARRRRRPGGRARRTRPADPPRTGLRRAPALRGPDRPGHRRPPGCQRGRGQAVPVRRASPARPDAGRARRRGHRRDHGRGAAMSENFESGLRDLSTRAAQAHDAGAGLPMAVMVGRARRRRALFDTGMTLAAAAVVGVLVLGAAAARVMPVSNRAR